MARFRVTRSRTVLVAVWLVAAIQFLWWKQPGFWRSPFLRYEQARMLASDRRNGEAIAEMERALAEDPDNAGYATYKGHLELVEQRYDDAETSFTRAIRLRADEIEARLGLAEALVRQARADEAIRALAALDGRTLDVDQRVRRRALHALAGDFEGALADPGLLERDVSDPLRLRDGLRWAMAARQWERAVVLADRVLASTDNPAASADATNEKAIAVRALGRPSEALALFEQVPTPDNLVARAELSLELERYQDAARLIGERVDQEPLRADLLSQRAYALEQSGRREEAVVAYRLSLEADDALATRIQLATLLNTLRRYSEAWVMLSLLPRPSADTALLGLQARTAFWAGHLAESDDLFARVRSSTPGDRAIESDLGFALAQGGDAERAERIYRRLLARADDTRTRLRLTDLLNNQRRYAEAWTVARVLDAGGGDVEILRLQADTAFWAGDYAEAMPRLRAYVSLAPGGGDPWRNLAEAARQLRDDVAEEGALAEYLRVQPADITARERHAGLLEAQGRLDAAIGEYRIVFDAQPRAGTARTLGYLEERQGRTADAIRHYTDAWDLSPMKDPTLALLLARLHRASGRPRDALMWHERYWPLADAAQRREIAVEAAWLAIEVGEAAKGFAFVEERAKAGEASAAELLVAARATGDTGNANAAVGFLERLSQKRPLDLSEQIWLAGLYRTSGDSRAALRQIEALAARPGSAPALFEAIGDLRWELRDVAGAANAYDTARKAAPSPALTLKVARLEASQDQYEAALREYQSYLVTERADGLRLEIARVSLGAGAWADAERWAREAAAAGEGGYAADMTLAEALHLQGKVVESVGVFDTLPAELRDDVGALEMYGLLAAARNQHLRAVRLFQSAIDGGGADPGRLWYLSGVSALDRYDVMSATTALERARTAGQPLMLVESAFDRLDRRAPPAASVPLRIFGDSDGLSVTESGARGSVWPLLRVPLYGEVTAGRVLQRGTTLTRQRAVVGVTDVFLAPALMLDAEAGAERYASGSLLVGRGTATFLREDTSFVRVGAHRTTLWSAHDDRDPRHFNRVVDLARLDPGMPVTGFTTTTDTALAPHRRLLLEGGVDRYGDDNRRGSVYGHYEMVTTARPDRWIAFAPNLFWESYRRRTPVYYSPKNYVAVGGLWHAIRTTPAWRVELEANPAATWFQSDISFAAHGLVDVARTWNRVTLGAGAFFLYDQRARYGSYRIVGQLDLRVGH
jgi:tetratricopeptide (TPR) repeat protein